MIGAIAEVSIASLEADIERVGRQSRSEKALKVPVHGASVHALKSQVMTCKMATDKDRIGTGHSRSPAEKIFWNKKVFHEH